MRTNYAPWFRPGEDGQIYWVLDDAYKLVAGWLPLEDDDKQLSPKLTAPNNRAKAEQLNLMSDFRQLNPRCRMRQHEVDVELEADAGVKHIPTHYVHASDFIEWAKSEGYAIPTELQHALSETSDTEKLDIHTGVKVNPIAPKWEILNTWEHEARRRGEAWMLDEEKREKKRPGVDAIAKFLEGDMSTEGRMVKGKRGRFLDWQTIKKEALTGITGRKRKGEK